MNKVKVHEKDTYLWLAADEGRMLAYSISAGSVYTVS